MTPLAPRAVLREVAAALPPELRAEVVVIGSLAAAARLLPDDTGAAVRTKDVDCVIASRIYAVDRGRELTQRLLAAGWSPYFPPEFPAPGDAATPSSSLPVVRLRPPGGGDWFLELLAEPTPGQRGRRFERLAVAEDRHFALPSFAFGALATSGATPFDGGMRCALPERMALAHFLEHPTLRPDRIRATGQRRCNKDLGRALAIAWLDVERLDSWPASWRAGLEEIFPISWQPLAARCGDGLRALLASPADLLEAAEICAVGLLAGRGVGAADLAATGRRLEAIVVRDVEAMGRAPARGVPEA